MKEFTGKQEARADFTNLIKSCGRTQWAPVSCEQGKKNTGPRRAVSHTASFLTPALPLHPRIWLKQKALAEDKQVIFITFSRSLPTQCKILIFAFKTKNKEASSSFIWLLCLPLSSLTASGSLNTHNFWYVARVNHEVCDDLNRNKPLRKEVSVLHPKKLSPEIKYTDFPKQIPETSFLKISKKRKKTITELWDVEFRKCSEERVSSSIQLTANWKVIQQAALIINVEGGCWRIHSLYFLINKKWSKKNPNLHFL